VVVVEVVVDIVGFSVTFVDDVDVDVTVAAIGASRFIVGICRLGTEMVDIAAVNDKLKQKTIRSHSPTWVV
jgi:hypothetical protein